MTSPLISLIIRTKNEESWIRKCLTMVFSQTYSNFEVIVVDNKSSDMTRKILEEFPINEVVELETYSPGIALNAGVKVCGGSLVAMLSAHCVPESPSWLEKLAANFSDPSVAGVYGRQLPLPFSDPLDKNDLLMAFGPEKRVQSKDWFFHNANSMIRKSAWEKVPFDETATNIEDRLWARDILMAGYKVVYEPEAAVFHFNGLHRSINADRIRRHVEIVERTDPESTFWELPEAATNSVQVTAIVPANKRNTSSPHFTKLLNKTLELSAETAFVKDTYVPCPPGLSLKEGVIALDRSKDPDSETKDLTRLLQWAAGQIELNSQPPDYYLYLNWDFLNRAPDFPTKLIETAIHGGFDTVFGAVPSYSHYWWLNPALDDYEEIDSSLSARDERDPVWEAIYGLGTLVRASILRSGRLTGGKVGIISIEDESALTRVANSNKSKSRPSNE